MLGGGESKDSFLVIEVGAGTRITRGTGFSDPLATVMGSKECAGIVFPHSR